MMDAPITQENYDSGFLGSFLSNSLKTNQLEVNTDARTLRPVARLKEPRDLFALPKERDYDCPQQAARWPTECQVLDERIYHIEYAPDQPEPYYQPTGKELQPRPVGEENGVVVYNYQPISAVHYGSEDNTSSNNESGKDSSSSSNSKRNSSNNIASNSDYGSYNDEPDFWNEINFSLPSNSKRGSKATLAENKSDCSDNEEDEGTVTDDESNKNVSSSSVNRRCRSSSSTSSMESIYNSEIESLQCYDGDVDEDHLQNMDKQSCTCVNLVDRKIFCSCRLLNLSQVEKKSSYEKPKKARKNSNSKINNNNKTCPRVPRPPPRQSNKQKRNSIQQSQPVKQQFSRSAVGGSKYLLSCHPTLEPTDLIFESRFESGNLAKAVKITPTYYELYLRPDMYTNRHTQWFYFRVKNTKKGIVYRFSIINLTKPDSLYKEGMRPLMYSNTDATNRMIGWRRCGENIAYFRNDDNGYSINSFASKFVNANGEEEEDDNLANVSFTLTFNIEFDHDNDTVYFAHSYPYTYSDLQDYLMAIQRHPVKSKFCKLRLLCRSLAGNNVYYLTVTAPSAPEDENQKKKKAIVISGRVHAGESPASWMMKGFMDFITGDSFVAKKLRHKFIFKLIPMLNPDGVIVGNTRSSLTGRDLNRQYRTVIRETYPSIWNTKAMIKRLMEDCGVAMYCDMHAHSRKHNIFIYGCENLKRHPDRRLLEQVFPLMLHKNVADKFSFENCKFKVQKNKEGTGRIVVWVLGVTNSYTLEASFAGSTMGSRNGTHFSTADFEHIGRAYCETLMDYYDDNPVKVNKYLKLIDKMRKKERKLRRQMKAAKKNAANTATNQTNFENSTNDDTQTYQTPSQQDFSNSAEKLRLKILTRLSKEGSSADEPLNIPLSDYSSDEGDTSSTSTDDEGKDRLSDLEGPCCQPLKVPPCSPVHEEKPKKKVKKKTTVKMSTSSAGGGTGGKKKNKSVRTSMSMPTTDPGSDFFELSSDEELTDVDGDGNITRIRNRSKIRATEGYKKLVMYESQTSTTQLIMPPELIITSAKVVDDQLQDENEEGKEMEESSPQENNTTTEEKENSTVTKNILKELIQQQPKKEKSETKVSFSQNIIKEFPPMTHRTKSWHSFNRCLSTIRIRNPNDFQTAENLQLKLSLKKQIWTGSQSVGISNDTTTLDISRPLSWGRGQIIKPVQYDSMALLTACSKKLAEWQETQGDGIRTTTISQQQQQQQQRRPAMLGGDGGRSPQKSQTQPNLQSSSITTTTTITASSKERDTNTQSTQLAKKLSPVIGDAANGMSRIRRKTKAICRIVETADILSNFTKRETKASPPHRTILTPVKGTTTTNRDKRFKTSGLVATAVQSAQTRNNKSHHSNGLPRKSNHRTTNIAQRQLSSHIYNTESSEENSRSVKIALRKTKSSSNCMKNKLANEQNNKKT